MAHCRRPRFALGAKRAPMTRYLTIACLLLAISSCLCAVAASSQAVPVKFDAPEDFNDRDARARRDPGNAPKYEPVVWTEESAREALNGLWGGAGEADATRSLARSGVLARLLDIERRGSSSLRDVRIGERGFNLTKYREGQPQQPALSIAAGDPALRPSVPHVDGSHPDGQLVTDFVQRAGTRFVVPGDGGCRPWHFAGFNNYYLMLRAARPDTRHEVAEVLDRAQELGLKVVRTWAFSDGPGQWRTLQPAPGEWDEELLRGMDWVLHQASLRGVRVLPVFANYWSHYGGVDQYNRWSFQMETGRCNGEFWCRDDFFVDPAAKAMYKNHVRTWLERINVFNGRRYRDDPTIFAWNLMNEPRSTFDLYVERRNSTDPTLPDYNITTNDGAALQAWIEEMAAFVKSIDPVHLLTTGQEGFIGPSSPLHLHANPGAWAQIEGNDFVRNHNVPGIDFATMHLYVDQWLCDAEGKDERGQLGFLKRWILGHQQAAEEELGMPVVLEEFGAKVQKRSKVYQAAFDACTDSARRGGSCGGVMFWILYHQDYAPLDRFGGGYGVYVPPATPEAAESTAMVREFARTLDEINAAGESADACVWTPPPPSGRGCGTGIEFELRLGGMPWTCLPGEPAKVDFCNPRDRWTGRGSRELYSNPPEAWLGAAANKSLPFHTIEAIVSGRIVNNGAMPVSLRGAYVILPFSQAVHTKYEGVWERIRDPNTYFSLYCWYAAMYDGNGDAVSGTNLCKSPATGIGVRLTDIAWPDGTKRDRGIRLDFGDVVLPPGGYIAGSRDGKRVMLSFKDGTFKNRLDVSSLELRGASECPALPAIPDWPPPPPPPPPPCTAGKHPWRACPALEWYFGAFRDAPVARKMEGFERLEQRSPAPSSEVVVRTPTVPVAAVPGEPIAPGRLVMITAVVSLSGSVRKVNGEAEGEFARRKSKTADGGTEEARVISDTPNPEDRGGAERKGLPTDVVLEGTMRDGVRVRRTVAHAIVRTDGRNVTLRGVVEIDDDMDPDSMGVFLEVPRLGPRLEVLSLSAQRPHDLRAEDADKYSPCTLHPLRSPDAVYAVRLPDGAGAEDDVLDVEICSRGYAQKLHVFEDGWQVATAGQSDPAGWAASVRIRAGREYRVVLDGDPGLPYGSWRGGQGLRMRWRSGRAFDGRWDGPRAEGWEAKFVRVQNASLMIGCERFAYGAGCNTWDLMDLARYEHRRHEVVERLDDMRARGWLVGRTWGFSLGTGESEERRRDRLHLTPTTYDEKVFRGMDFVLAEARKRGLRLIVALEDFWLSIDRYVEWSDNAESKTDFYTDWQAREMYKQHVWTWLSRRNTFNGVKYLDDETIFAINLISEPRCTGCGWAMQAWIDEMALAVKAMDPNHIVTVGSEGFYSSTCDRVWLNPGAGKRRVGIGSSPWALQEGQDFMRDGASPHLDAVTIHAWPDNWLGYADFCDVPYVNPSFDYTHGCDLWREKLDWTRNWIAAHIEDAKSIGKAAIVQEFGKALPSPKLSRIPDALMPGERVADGLWVRNQFFEAVYDLVERDALAGGNTQGTNFWNLYRESHAATDLYRVTLSDTSTMRIVDNHAARMRAVGDLPGECPANLTRADVAAVAERHAAAVEASASEMRRQREREREQERQRRLEVMQAGGCVDRLPAGSRYPCELQKEWGKCGERWIVEGGYCMVTCGRCGSEAACDDVQPPGGYTCAQQAGWGACDAAWMLQGRYCRSTCGLCSKGRTVDHQAVVRAAEGPGG
ncbi:unnamed protein product [Pedinophyceae sp. YPF-701]|nr:unnamed protein product [Pedinophyceae sp. YPF-701]